MTAITSREFRQENRILKRVEIVHDGPILDRDHQDDFGPVYTRRYGYANLLDLDKNRRGDVDNEVSDNPDGDSVEKWTWTEPMLSSYSELKERYLARGKEIMPDRSARHVSVADGGIEITDFAEPEPGYDEYRVDGFSQNHRSLADVAQELGFQNARVALDFKRDEMLIYKPRVPA